MGCLDAFGTSQVGYGACQLEDTMKGPCRKAKLLHGCSQQSLARHINNTAVLDLHRCHISVASQLAAPEALLLENTSTIYPCPH
jgi:hypothetical protein